MIIARCFNIQRTTRRDRILVAIERARQAGYDDGYEDGLSVGLERSLGVPSALAGGGAAQKFG